MTRSAHNKNTKSQLYPPMKLPKIYMRFTALCCALWMSLSAAAQSPDSIPAGEVLPAGTGNLLSQMTADEYMRLQLPPLHVLMQNARRNSPQVNVYAANKELEERELKNVRRTWLQHFKLNASYSYGSTDVTSQQYYNQQYPIIQNVTGTTQSWWNLGASVSFPLDEIFNRRNKIKQQKKKIESIEYEVERWHDDICLKIIEAYTTAVQYLSLLESASAEMAAAKAQYTFSKTDFINGKIDMQELSRHKSIESSAIREYEKSRAELNKAILQLEILSKTPIITPPEEFEAR